MKNVTTKGAEKKEARRIYPPVPDGLLTPDKVPTSIGQLEFTDGVPSLDTTEKLYDYLDTMRGVDAFMKGMPAASLRAIVEGPAAIGVDAIGKMLIFADYMDSKPIFLTGNTSTIYVMPYLDLKESGPLVMEVPKGALGALNDAWFRYMFDFKVLGNNEVKKYLLVPPGEEVATPKGDYEVVQCVSYRHWAFLRFPIPEGGTADEMVKLAENGVKVYPYQEEPQLGKFYNGSGKSFNTIHFNDYSFYRELNDVIQHEPYEVIDPETRGLLAAIGIEKGKRFDPDLRMERILTDAVAIANGISRSLVWKPRYSGSVDNMKGVRLYPHRDSAWLAAYVGKNVFFNGEDGHTLNTDARAFFHYIATGVTPAMAEPKVGRGSDYAIAFVDSQKKPLDGSKTYKLNIPVPVPARDFWAVTMYDTQTRSQLQTDQALPTVGSNVGDIQQNDKGSYDIYFGPTAPEGYESNWLQTIPGKSWFPIIRIYGPLPRWIEKVWKPGEIEPWAYGQ